MLKDYYFQISPFSILHIVNNGNRNQILIKTMCKLKLTLVALFNSPNLNHSPVKFDAVDKRDCSFFMSRPATAHVKLGSLSIVLAISSTTNWPVKPVAPNTMMLNFRGSAGSITQWRWLTANAVTYRLWQLLPEWKFLSKFKKSAKKLNNLFLLQMAEACWS